MSKPASARNPGITEALVLQCYELLNLQYIPDDLGPRNAQYEEIVQYIEGDSGEGAQACGVFLSGNPANGKTTVIKRLMRNYDAVYVNAAEHRSPAQALLELYYGVCGRRPLSGGISQQRAFESLQAAIDKRVKATAATRKKEKQVRNSKSAPRSEKLLLVVDEVDFIVLNARKRDRGFYLYKLLDLKKVSLVFASNSLNFMDELSREGSRLHSFQEVQFREYTAEEKMQILNVRLKSLGGADALFEKNAAQLLALRGKLTDLRSFLTQAYRAIYTTFKHKKPKVTAAEVNAVTARHTRPLQLLSDLQLVILKSLSQNVANVYLYVQQELGDDILEQDVIEQLEELAQSNLIANEYDKVQKKTIQQVLVSKRTIQTEIEERENGNEKNQ